VKIGLISKLEDKTFTLIYKYRLFSIHTKHESDYMNHENKNIHVAVLVTKLPMHKHDANITGRELDRNFAIEKQLTKFNQIELQLCSNHQQKLCSTSTWLLALVLLIGVLVYLSFMDFHRKKEPYLKWLALHKLTPPFQLHHLPHKKYKNNP